MAKANLQRNKRRTVFIVISLTLSIVLLNSVFIVSGSFDEDAYIEKQTRSDFMVYSPGIQAAFGNDFGHNSTVPEKAVEEIKEQPGVTNEVYLYRNTFEEVSELLKQETNCREAKLTPARAMLLYLSLIHICSVRQARGGRPPALLCPFPIT